MMKCFYSYLLLLFLGISLSCSNADRDNSRIYIEGKITEAIVNTGGVTIKIVSNNIVIAETDPKDSGNFVLSGPLITDDCLLEVNKKIKSFSVSKSGCTLDTTSKKIIIPSGTSYLTFNEIVLE